jgi:hypothetical protein
MAKKRKTTNADGTKKYPVAPKHPGAKASASQLNSYLRKVATWEAKKKDIDKQNSNLLADRKKAETAKNKIAGIRR